MSYVLVLVVPPVVGQSAPEAPEVLVTAVRWERLSSVQVRRVQTSATVCRRQTSDGRPCRRADTLAAFARTALAEVVELARQAQDEVTEAAVLLLGELMTNAYRHAKASPGREIRARCAPASWARRTSVEALARLPPPFDDRRKPADKQPGRSRIEALR
ncbi:hypothetical protein ACFYNZ_24360 [Streptomyces kebangsaanensis]|uniref:ATP-binding protein n=1 Tax=Streptomyces kebangsaanensis TaxID=864058 RepID=A0ABW6L1K4_9ACTN